MECTAIARNAMGKGVFHAKPSETGISSFASGNAMSDPFISTREMRMERKRFLLQIQHASNRCGYWHVVTCICNFNTFVYRLALMAGLSFALQKVPLDLPLCLPEDFSP